MLCRQEDINDNITEQRKYIVEYTVLARCKVVSWRADCLILKNKSYDPSEPPKITRLSASQRNCIFSIKAARILYLCYRASLICINNCPTRCNTKQSIYYSASSLYMFRVSAIPIIRSTPPFKMANVATLKGGSRTKNMTSTGGCSYSFVYS